MSKEFTRYFIEDFFISWEGCLRGGMRKVILKVSWMKPEAGFHKFNVDGAARGKPGPAGGGILHDDKGRMILALLEFAWVIKSNEGE